MSACVCTDRLVVPEGAQRAHDCGGEMEHVCAWLSQKRRSTNGWIFDYQYYDTLSAKQRV